jgi:hypothetical protein
VTLGTIFPGVGRRVGAAQSRATPGQKRSASQLQPLRGREGLRRNRGHEASYKKSPASFAGQDRSQWELN